MKTIGVGSPLVDILARVDDAFIRQHAGEKGGMVMLESAALNTLVSQAELTGLAPLETAPGGSAANTILGLLKLGHQAAFLGKVGKDARGQYFLDSFRQAGGDASKFKTSADVPSGSCLSLVTPDAQRTLRPFLGAAATLSPDEVSVDDFRGFGLAHIEGYVLFNRPLAERILKCAREAGCKISLDLASFEVVRANTDILNDLLNDYVDLVFANEDEAKAFSGHSNPVDALDRLEKLCATAAVKLGPDGAVISQLGRRHRVGARRVTAIDTTGAGDLWASGLLAGLQRGWDVERSAALAAATGAAVVQIMGASIPEATWKQIRSEFPQG